MMEGRAVKKLFKTPEAGPLPPQPVEPKTAQALFSAERLPQLRREHSTQQFFYSELNAEWRALPAAQRGKWERMATRDKERYDAELAAFKEWVRVKELTVPPVTKALLALVVSFDTMCRDTQDFPLVDAAVIDRLRAVFRPVRYAFMAPDVVALTDNRANGRQLYPVPVVNSVDTLTAELRSWPLFDEWMRIGREERGLSDVELVFAGGAVSRALTKQRYGMASDLDVFFVSPSLDTKAATKLLLKLVVAAMEHLGAGFVLARNEMCTTIWAREADDNSKHQLIHRLYPSAASVVGGFDLGSCAVMLHNYFERVSCTHLGAWSIALGVNIVDVSRRSASYEQRLAKYCHRGYRVVLPGLETARVEAVVGELQSMRLLKMAIVKAAPVNRYRDEVGPLCNYVIDSQSLEGSLQGMFCHLRNYAFDIPYYPGLYLGSQNYSAAMQGLFSRILAWYDVDVDERPPGTQSASAILAKCRVFSEHVRHFAAHSSAKSPATQLRARFGDRAKEYIEAELAHDVAACERIKEETIAKVLNIFEERERMLAKGVTWRTDNPGGQAWTSSFDPIFENPRTFYLERNYSPFRVVVTDQVYHVCALIRRFVPEAALLPMNVWKRIAKLVVVCQYHELFQKPASFHPCAHCLRIFNAGVKRCSRCGIYYCGAGHQRAHWPVHMKECDALAASLITTLGAKIPK